MVNFICSEKLFFCYSMSIFFGFVLHLWVSSCSVLDQVLLPCLRYSGNGRWVRMEFGYLSSFIKHTKKEFLRANAIGILLLVFGYMLYVNLNFLQLDREWLQQLMKTLFIVVTIVYGIMLLYIFPLYVHYENKLYLYFKNAILIALYSPVRTIYLIAACLTLYYLYFVLPVFIFFLRS